jgi:hypothetical protein
MEMIAQWGRSLAKIPPCPGSLFELGGPQETVEPPIQVPKGAWSFASWK